MKLLLAEDTQDLNRAVTALLKHEQYEVDSVFDGEEALEHIMKSDYDGVILDIMMPKKDGLEVLREMRSRHILTPVLLLTAKAEVDDRVNGLDAGADDYLTKPFSVEEMLARLRVIVRRLNQLNADRNGECPVYTNGNLTIDYSAGCAWLGSEELKLTPMEYKLLCLLAKNTGKVLTHNYITQSIWGRSWDNDIASLRVFMATLRKKLESEPASPQFIQTHIGIGYRMVKVDTETKLAGEEK